MKLKFVLLIGFAIAALLFLAGVSWWGYTQMKPVSFQMAVRGSRTLSDEQGVSGGNLVVVAPKPGTYFGTVIHNGEERFSYVIFFRYGRPKSQGSGHSTRSHCTSDGTKAESDDMIELDGKKLEANVRIEFNEARTEIAKETLTIGGKVVDATLGRVFLIDLASENPAYRQVDVQLPAIPSQLESPEDVKRLVEKLHTQLEQEDPQIKEFLFR